MIITKLEDWEKSKVKVYMDDTFVFVLYKKDIEVLCIEEGMQIPSTTFDKILETITIPRAKQKALYVLKFMDRSEHELRRKLKEAGYTENIIDLVITYVYEYGYLDDTRYATSYIRMRMNTKSKLAIQTELMHKGLDKELIRQALSQEYQVNAEEGEVDAELIAIQKAIRKKTKSVETLTELEKQKLKASLYRKGFDYNKINQLLN
jgi:regulatory protein